MLRKGLIRIKGRIYFEIDEHGLRLTQLFLMLSNVQNWFDVILRDYKDKTGQEALSAVLYAKPTAQYMRTITNAGMAIDSRNSVSNQRKNRA